MKTLRYCVVTRYCTPLRYRTVLCWLLAEQCCEPVNLVSAKIGKKKTHTLALQLTLLKRMITCCSIRALFVIQGERTSFYWTSFEDWSSLDEVRLSSFGRRPSSTVFYFRDISLRCLEHPGSFSRQQKGFAYVDHIILRSANITYSESWRPGPVLASATHVAFHLDREKRPFLEDEVATYPLSATRLVFRGPQCG